MKCLQRRTTPLEIYVPTLFLAENKTALRLRCPAVVTMQSRSVLRKNFVSGTLFGHIEHTQILNLAVAIQQIAHTHTHSCESNEFRCQIETIFIHRRTEDDALLPPYYPKSWFAQNVEMPETIIDLRTACSGVAQTAAA